MDRFLSSLPQFKKKLKGEWEKKRERTSRESYTEVCLVAMCWWVIQVEHTRELLLLIEKEKKSMLQVCNTEKKTEGKLKAIIETINEFFFFFCWCVPIFSYNYDDKREKEKKKKSKAAKSKINFVLWS